jgi:hypothetical protein
MVSQKSFRGDELGMTVQLTVQKTDISRLYCAGILEQSMGAMNQVGKELLYRPSRLHRLAESIPGIRKSLKIPSRY